MKHLCIVVPDGKGNNLSSIIGSYKIFSRANQLKKERGEEAVFKVEIIGVSESLDYYDGLFSITPHALLPSIAHTDFVIIPAINHRDAQVLEENKTLVDWVKKQYINGAEVASICTGAFLLAATGLLDGKKCSTHWSAEEQFLRMYPKVNLQTDLLITDENGIYTNGGAYSFLNLLFYLVEKYYDRDIALSCARTFQIDISRHLQSEFIMFSNQKTHGDEMVEEAQLYIEKHITDKIPIDLLCSIFSVGRRNFDRRFVAATGNSPLEYIQRAKMEVAKRTLETTRKNINDVMFDIGYSDIKSFREMFKKITGLSPLEYKKKYNKEALA
jgi:transcriptional regulator GlxA family with amidase domain